MSRPPWLSELGWEELADEALVFLQTLLRIDLIFAAVADEEAGCELGSMWLVEHHPETVRARICFGEVGGFTLHVGSALSCRSRSLRKACAG